MSPTGTTPIRLLAVTLLAVVLAPAALAGGEPKNEPPFTRPAAGVGRDPKSPVIQGEAKNMAPFTNRVA